MKQIIFFFNGVAMGHAPDWAGPVSTAAPGPASKSAAPRQAYHAGDSGSIDFLPSFIFKPSRTEKISEHRTVDF